MLVFSGAIASFLQQARRRYFWILMLTQSAHAASAALVALILLLLVGTQVMDWYWPALLLTAGLLFIAFRVWRSLPTRYSLAQIIDQHCALPDTVSTAYFFRDQDSETFDLQRRQAEQAVVGLQLPSVFPFHLPRTAYATLALTLIAGSILGVRYGTSGTLEFEHPLIPIDLAAFSRDLKDGHQAEEKRKKLAESSKKEGVPLPNADQPEPPAGTPPDTPFKAINAPEPNGISQTSDKGQKTKEAAPNGDQGSEEPMPGQADKQAASKGDQDQQGNDVLSRNAPQPDGKGQQPQPNQQPGQQSNQPGGNSSLLDKMRDAMANLMNKMKSPQQGNDSKQASNNNSQQKNGQPQAANQKGTPTNGSPQSDKASASDQNEGQPGESDKSQSAQNKAGDKSSPQSSNDSKSGVGAQDGSKDLKNAEQLEAMGKISELIGRRSANVQGEVTIEVSSGKQQLLTPYLKRQAGHGESNGDASRDEIPLAYQNYVQQYFEQIHREKPGKGHSDNPGAKRGVAN